MIGLPPEPLIVIPDRMRRGRVSPHRGEPHLWAEGPPVWRCTLCGVMWAHPRIPTVSERHVAALYANGASYQAIARRLHVSKGRVRAIVLRAGGRIRGRGERP